MKEKILEGLVLLFSSVALITTILFVCSAVVFYVLNKTTPVMIMGSVIVISLFGLAVLVWPQRKEMRKNDQD